MMPSGNSTLERDEYTLEHDDDEEEEVEDIILSPKKVFEDFSKHTAEEYITEKMDLAQESGKPCLI
jgi:hypothetical protein